METVLYGIAIPALITGLVQVAKILGLDKRFSYLLALVVGVGVMVGHVFFGDWPVFEAVVVGLTLGLIAMGIYDTGEQTERLLKGD